MELAKAFGSDNSSKFVNGVLGTAYKKLGIIEDKSHESRDKTKQADEPAKGGEPAKDGKSDKADDVDKGTDSKDNK